MPAFLKFYTTTAAAILWWSWITVAEKQNIEYWSQPGSEYTCKMEYEGLNLTRNDCGKDDTYGGCAYAPNAADPMVWCCPPGDASCWGWGQACQTGKKECNSGTIKWCCDEVYEDCEFEFNKVSLCLLKTALFANPLSASPSTLDSTMSSTRFTATIEVTAIAVVAPSDATASSRSTITRSSGPTSTERPASSEAPTLTSATSAAASASAAASPGISTGAAAGAGVGGVLGFIAIVVGVFCLMRRSRRRRQEEDGGEKVAGGSVGGDPSVGLMSPQGWPPVAISECAGTPVQNRHELETKTWHHELDVNPLELEAMQRPVGAMLPQRNVTEMQRPRW